MKAQIVSFHCVLKNRFGQVLSTSFNRDIINQLDTRETSQSGATLSGLAAAIQDVKPGERRQFVLSANEAYGPYDPSLTLTLKRSELSEGKSLAMGSEVELRDPATGRKRRFRVVKISGNRLELDGNHPLAGQDLVFDIEVVSAREARLEDFEDDGPAPAGQYLH